MRAPWVLLGVIALAGSTLPTACKNDEGGGQGGGGTGTGSTTGTTTSSTSTGTTANSAGGTGSTGAAGSTGAEGECSIWTQDCPQGDKCMPWSMEGDLIPDTVQCCPEVANPDQVGDPCTVEGYFGSCMDSCVKGSLCLDIDDDGVGTCSAFCSGDPDNPECGVDQNCFIYFSGVPLCFDRCDPLLQDCQGDYGCYPDAEAAGGTDFVCMPQISPQPLGGYCWLLSNCEPGLICVTSDFYPGCDSLVGCCTSLCDISEPDPCPAIHPDLECVPWYSMGGLPPQPYLANVGACVLPL